MEKMKSVITIDEYPRCSVKRNLFIEMKTLKLDMVKDWKCSLQFSTQISKHKTTFINIYKDTDVDNQIIVLNYVYHYHLSDNLIIKLYKKSKKENKVIGTSKISINQSLLTKINEKTKIIGIGKYNGIDFGEIELSIESLPIECEKPEDLLNYQHKCLTALEIEKVEEIGEKTVEKGRIKGFIKKMHNPRKEQTVIKKRSITPLEEELTEVDDEHDDTPLNEIKDGIIMIVQGKKKRSAQMRKIITESIFKEKYHFVEVFNGDFNKDVIPFLLEMTKSEKNIPIVICGGDWFIGLFVRQIAVINERKKQVDISPFIIPMTKDCLVAQELGKIDIKYKSSFGGNWLTIIESDIVVSMQRIEEYLTAKYTQKMMLSEVCYLENEQTINIPMIVTSKIICDNKTVTVDYWKIKDKKIQPNKIKKSLESIEIFKENGNENFVLIITKSKKKDDEKDERIVCNKIIISSENSLRLFVERMLLSSSTNYITFKQDSHGNSLSIHSFN